MTNPPNDPAGYGSGGVSDVGELPRIPTPATAPSEPTRPATPELDRQSEIINSGKAGTVQEFLDWLHNERGYQLCEPVPNSLHGYYGLASYGGPEQLMADFFGIDRDKIEAERRALLDHIRSAQ